MIVVMLSVVLGILESLSLPEGMIEFPKMHTYLGNIGLYKTGRKAHILYSDTSYIAARSTLPPTYF